MPHATSGNKVYRLPINDLIANMHSVLAVIKAGFDNRKLSVAKRIKELKEIFPYLPDSAAENLLDGFYLVEEDGSIKVDDVPWGRR